MHRFLIALALAGCGTPGDETGKAVEGEWGRRHPCPADDSFLALTAPSEGAMPFALLCGDLDDDGGIGCRGADVYARYGDAGVIDYATVEVYCNSVTNYVYIRWLD